MNIKRRSVASKVPLMGIVSMATLIACSAVRNDELADKIEETTPAERVFSALGTPPPSTTQGKAVVPVGAPIVEADFQNPGNGNVGTFDNGYALAVPEGSTDRPWIVFGDTLVTSKTTIPEPSAAISNCNTAGGVTSSTPCWNSDAWGRVNGSPGSSTPTISFTTSAGSGTNYAPARLNGSQTLNGGVPYSGFVGADGSLYVFWSFTPRQGSDGGMQPGVQQNGCFVKSARLGDPRCGATAADSANHDYCCDAKVVAGTLAKYQAFSDSFDSVLPLENGYRDLPWNFQYSSPVIRGISSVPGLYNAFCNGGGASAGLCDATGKVLILWHRNAGRNPKVAFVPYSQVEDTTKWRFLTGVDASGNLALETWDCYKARWPRGGAPAGDLSTGDLWSDPYQTISDINVSWNPYLGKYLMTETDWGGAAKRSIYYRTSDTPWGQWSGARKLIDWEVDAQYSHINPGDTPCKANCTVNSLVGGYGPNNLSLNGTGRLYTPVVIPQFTTQGSTPQSTKIHFTLSTGNPYTVRLVSAELALKSVNVPLPSVVEMSQFPNSAGEPLVVTGPDDVNWRRNAGDNHLEAFALMSDGSIRHQWKDTPSAGWSNWFDLKGAGQTIYFTTAPTVISAPDGHLEVFAVDAINAVWRQHTSSTGAWSPQWEPFGNGFQGTIAGSNNQNTTPSAAAIELFARGTNNHLYHRWMTNQNPVTWTSWIDVGNVITSSPAVITAPGPYGYVEVYAATSATAIGVKYKSGGTWSSMLTAFTSPSTLVGKPSAVRNELGTTEVFFNTVNGIGHIWGAPSATPYAYQSIPGTFQGSPIAVRNGGSTSSSTYHSIEVMAVGADGALWHFPQSRTLGAWGPWTRLESGQTFFATPGVGVNADGRVEVVTEGASTHLPYTTFQQTPGAF